MSGRIGRGSVEFGKSAVLEWEGRIAKEREARDRDVAKWREQRHISANEMKIEIANTLHSVKEIWDRLPVSARKNLKVRLTHQAFQLAQTIRADGRMPLSV